MKLIVDIAQRYAKMRAHTATHLLHTELAKLFKNTKQAGSLVDIDYLRFDFNADRLLTPEEIYDVEKNINQIIYNSYVVDVHEMSFDEATALWAKAFFEDKYWDTVRVVKVLNQDNEIVSIELCGWTHVVNTKEIGCFAITWQETVASWIKRIVAVTGPKVFSRIYEIQEILDVTIKKLWIKTATQLADKIDKTVKENYEMKWHIGFLETTIIKNILEWFDFSSWKDLDKVFVIPLQISFKNVLFQAKWMFENQNILLYTKEGNFALLANRWVSAKKIAEQLNLTWWWSNVIVQWKDENVLSLFI